MSIATSVAALTSVSVGKTNRPRKVLVAISAPIPGNLDGTDVYEIHDGSNFARVRLAKGQDVQELIKVLDNFQFLYVCGRHDISRIHLFIAQDTEGNSFKFAMTYSQVYKIGLLTNLHHVYMNLKSHSHKPVTMARKFPKKGVLAYDGRKEWEPIKGELDYLEVIGSDVMDFNWDV